MSINSLESDFKLSSIYIIEVIAPIGNVRGTCFSISKNLLLTAAHIIKDAKSINIYLSSDDFNDDNSILANCIYHDDSIDVAILEIAQTSNTNPIELYRTNISIDSKVRSCGYPVEKEIYHAPINIEVINTFSNVSNKQWSFEVSQSNTVTQYKGMSGSPVIYEGRCIGMLLVQQGNNTLYAVSIDDMMKKACLYQVIINNKISVLSQEGIMYLSPPHPKSPFKYCIHCTNGTPTIKGINIGFTFKRWNISEFTENVYDWIIDYSLSFKEREQFKQNSRSLFKYARSKYPESDLNALGDLCLHIAIRESYSTIPIMNRVFDSHNRTFSCTHAILNFDKIELWIGASSVSTCIDEAVENVIENINYISELHSLKNRLYAITSEIDASWPHQEKLERLTNSNLPIDKRFDKIIIPIFIMHDSTLIQDYDETSFMDSFKKKIEKCRSLINSGNINQEIIQTIDLKVFYFPVSSIKELNNSLIEELHS